jgi:predicted house-cleaning noncanonical NTP pyrophosphatase (MazG superfamily)
MAKLVRDKIPEIIRASGSDLVCHVARDEEYNTMLIAKMFEEVQEFADSPSIDEAADVYEVFLTFLKNWGFELSDVRKFAQYKSRERGKFDGGIILDEVIEKN